MVSASTTTLPRFTENSGAAPAVPAAPLTVQIRVGSPEKLGGASGLALSRLAPPARVSSRRAPAASRAASSALEVASDVERDFYLSAIEAKEYGLIDEVLSKPKAGKDKKG